MRKRKARRRVDLKDFEGRWRIDRTIADHLLCRTGRFEGEARFAPSGAGLLYDEYGVLQFPGEAPLQAERRYLWRPAPSGIDVLFEDGRPFHTIELAAQRPAATHFCDPDTYEVQYDFVAWPRWEALWRVSGPRKDYEMRSTYVRPGG